MTDSRTARAVWVRLFALLAFLIVGGVVVAVAGVPDIEELRTSFAGAGSAGALVFVLV